MKKCNSCKNLKHESEYQVRVASKDGLTARCKKCLAVYDKKRSKNPERVASVKRYQKTEKGKASHKRAVNKWIEKNKFKRSVHIKTGNAIRDGILIKEPCEVCGKIKVCAHHDDYLKPLSVRWLCDGCHNDWHVKNGEGINANG